VVVVEVQQTAEDFGSHHQRTPGRAGTDHGIGHRQGIDKATAHRLHIKDRAARGAQLVLEDGGSGGEHHVRRGRGDDDEVNVLCAQAGGLQCVARRLQRQVAAGNCSVGEMPRLDARALHNPFVGRLDAAAGQVGHQFGIGHPARRKVTAGAGNSGIACH